jgi:hypothetical protein
LNKELIAVTTLLAFIAVDSLVFLDTVTTNNVVTAQETKSPYSDSKIKIFGMMDGNHWLTVEGAVADFTPQNASLNYTDPFVLNNGTDRQVQIIGIVNAAKFFPMDKNGSVGVTETGLKEQMEPSEMNLTEYEGKVIMISGEDEGRNLIYGAKVEDVANPILSAIAREIYSK